MDILVMLLVGLAVGVVARLIVPGRDPGGLLVTTVLGVAGAFAAGMIGHALGRYDAGEGPGVVASVFGAVILLAIYRTIADRRSW